MSYDDIKSLMGPEAASKTARIETSFNAHANLVQDLITVGKRRFPTISPDQMDVIARITLLAMLGSHYSLHSNEPQFSSLINAAEIALENTEQLNKEILFQTKHFDQAAIAEDLDAVREQAIFQLLTSHSKNDISITIEKAVQAAIAKEIIFPLHEDVPDGNYRTIRTNIKKLTNYQGDNLLTDLLGKNTIWSENLRAVLKDRHGETLSKERFYGRGDSQPALLSGKTERNDLAMLNLLRGQLNDDDLQRQKISQASNRSADAKPLNHNQLSALNSQLLSLNSELERRARLFQDLTFTQPSYITTQKLAETKVQLTSLQEYTKAALLKNTSLLNTLPAPAKAPEVKAAPSTVAAPSPEETLIAKMGNLSGQLNAAQGIINLLRGSALSPTEKISLNNTKQNLLTAQTFITKTQAKNISANIAAQLRTFQTNIAKSLSDIEQLVGATQEVKSTPPVNNQSAQRAAIFRNAFAASTASRPTVEAAPDRTSPLLNQLNRNVSQYTEKLISARDRVNFYQDNMRLTNQAIDSLENTKAQLISLRADVERDKQTFQTLQTSDTNTINTIITLQDDINRLITNIDQKLDDKPAYTVQGKPMRSGNSAPSEMKSQIIEVAEMKSNVAKPAAEKNAVFISSPPPAPTQPTSRAPLDRSSIDSVSFHHDAPVNEKQSEQKNPSQPFPATTSAGSNVTSAQPSVASPEAKRSTSATLSTPAAMQRPGRLSPLNTGVTRTQISGRPLGIAPQSSPVRAPTTVVPASGFLTVERAEAALAGAIHHVNKYNNGEEPLDKEAIEILLQEANDILAAIDNNEKFANTLSNSMKELKNAMELLQRKLLDHEQAAIPAANLSQQDEKAFAEEANRLGGIDIEHHVDDNDTASLPEQQAATPANVTSLDDEKSYDEEVNRINNIDFDNSATTSNDPTDSIAESKDAESANPIPQDDENVFWDEANRLSRIDMPTELENRLEQLDRLADDVQANLNATNPSIPSSLSHVDPEIVHQLKGRVKPLVDFFNGLGAIPPDNKVKEKMKLAKEKISTVETGIAQLNSQLAQLHQSTIDNQPQSFEMKQTDAAVSPAVSNIFTDENATQEEAFDENANDDVRDNSDDNNNELEPDLEFPIHFNSSHDDNDSDNNNDFLYDDDDETPISNPVNDDPDQVSSSIHNTVGINTEPTSHLGDDSINHSALDTSRHDADQADGMNSEAENHHNANNDANTNMRPVSIQVPDNSEPDIVMNQTNSNSTLTADPSTSDSTNGAPVGPEHTVANYKSILRDLDKSRKTPADPFASLPREQMGFVVDRILNSNDLSSVTQANGLFSRGRTLIDYFQAKMIEAFDPNETNLGKREKLITDWNQNLFLLLERVDTRKNDLDFILRALPPEEKARTRKAKSALQQINTLFDELYSIRSTIDNGLKNYGRDTVRFAANAALIIDRVPGQSPQDFQKEIKRQCDLLHNAHDLTARTGKESAAERAALEKIHPSHTTTNAITMQSANYDVNLTSQVAIIQIAGVKNQENSFYASTEIQKDQHTASILVVESDATHSSTKVTVEHLRADLQLKSVLMHAASASGLTQFLPNPNPKTNDERLNKLLASYNENPYTRKGLQDFLEKQVKQGMLELPTPIAGMPRLGPTCRSMAATIHDTYLNAVRDPNNTDMPAPKTIELALKMMEHFIKNTRGQEPIPINTMQNAEVNRTIKMICEVMKRNTYSHSERAKFEVKAVGAGSQEVFRKRLEIFRTSMITDMEKALIKVDKDFMRTLGVTDKKIVQAERQRVIERATFHLATTENQTRVPSPTKQEPEGDEPTPPTSPSMRKGGS